MNELEQIEDAIIELREVARRRGLSFGATKPAVINGKASARLDIGLPVEPPPLGIHVSDGLAGRDKVGGD